MMIIEKVIEKAKTDITEAVMRTKQETGLPMYMIELIVSGILGDIRDAKCREMVAGIMKEEKRREEGEDGGNDDSTNKPDEREETEI